MSGKLPDEITQTWQEVGSQYVTEFSTSAATATVTLAMAGESLTDPDVAEDILLDDYLLVDEDNLDDDDGPTIEEIMEMG